MLLAIAASMCQPLSPEIAVQIKKRKPKCSPLEVSHREMVRMEVSQTKQYYLKGRALSYDEETTKNLHHRAIEGNAASRKLKRKCENNLEKVPKRKLDHAMSTQRMAAIEYIYLVVHLIMPNQNFGKN